MTPFAQMVADLFVTDLAQDVVYRANGALPGVTIRAIPVAPDAEVGRFDVKARVTARQIDIQASDVPAPAETDLIEIAGEGTFKVRAPMADELRLTWRIELKAV